MEVRLGESLGIEEGALLGERFYEDRWPDEGGW